MLPEFAYAETLAEAEFPVTVTAIFPMLSSA